MTELATNRSAESEGKERPPPRVVYALPPISMGVVIARDGRTATVRVGAEARELEIDPSVDCALVDEAIADGRRVLLDPTTNTLCGVLQTQRSLTIDARGAVVATLTRLELSVREHALFRSQESFVQIDDDRVEVYARETLLRARGALRALAQLIKLN